MGLKPFEQSEAASINRSVSNCSKPSRCARQSPKVYKLENTDGHHLVTQAQADRFSLDRRGLFGISKFYSKSVRTSNRFVRQAARDHRQILSTESRMVFAGEGQPANFFLVKPKM